MDSNIQGSFIPKQALTAASRSGGVGIFFLLALLMFVMSVVSAGAAFGYQRILSGTITQKDRELRTAEGAFEAGTIQDLLRMDNRLAQANTLLHKHVAPSAILYFLSTITLERVQLNSFDMTLDKDGGASLNVTGVADSFSSVALQSDQFGSSKVLRDVIVSGVSVGESGKVSFSVNATVDKSLVLYSNNLGQNQQQPTQ